MPDDARSPKTKTTKEVAKHFGVSERTVRNHMAEERDTYEARADYRRNLAGTMRAQGKSWADVAAVGGSEWSARALV
jgi:predicted transcriptional regulator